MDIVTATIDEWRDLGFDIDLADVRCVWTITGSAVGLARFAQILRQFAANPRNDVPIEHDHFGPYGYLKVINVPDERGFNSKPSSPRDVNLQYSLNLSTLGSPLRTPVPASNSPKTLRLDPNVNFD